MPGALESALALRLLTGGRIRPASGLRCGVTVHNGGGGGGGFSPAGPSGFKHPLRFRNRTTALMLYPCTDPEP